MDYLNEKDGWDYELRPTEKYIVESGSSHIFYFVLDGKTINMCCHRGPCDDDIERALELPEIKDTFAMFSDKELDAWWEEMFVDDTEEEHRQADRKRKLSWLLFDACANAVDGYCYLYSDFIQILTMDDLFKAESGDILFFREKMNCYPKNPDFVLYEVYIKVPEGTEWNAPLPYDEMMEELGYEFMDRSEWFDYEGDKAVYDKWFKFLHDNGNYDN